MRRAARLLLAVVVLAACGGDDDDVEVPTMGGLTVTSTAFVDGATVPTEFTCDGVGDSPPLSWSGVPDNAAALALIVDDPDAPGGTYVHWIVVDIDTVAAEVEAGAVPRGGIEIVNDHGGPQYFGPCPPPPTGEHHYRFRVFALAARTGLTDGASKSEALAAIAEHAVADGTLTGVYSR